MTYTFWAVFQVDDSGWIFPVGIFENNDAAGESASNLKCDYGLMTFRKLEDCWFRLAYVPDCLNGENEEEALIQITNPNVIQRLEFLTTPLIQKNGQ